MARFRSDSDGASSGMEFLIRRSRLTWIILVMLVSVARVSLAADSVQARHAASLALRDAILRKTIAKPTAWPNERWGDNLWTLAALALNEKTDEANARLLTAAREFNVMAKKLPPQKSPLPEEQGVFPWTFFSLADYVRTLCLFHAKSPHFAGRLEPATEAAMKEAVWYWVRTESRIAETGPDDLFLLQGTENHDLNRRPNAYLITALLKNDPAYRDRKLADGHTVAEHADAHAAFFREWPRRRVASGMWVEVGSNTYQKYSWPALFNLHDLATDPVVRRRFGLFLDLALIEEEQISVSGRRGGGRSRADYDANGFEAMKSLLYGEDGASTHSRVIETSRYLPPIEAMRLRYETFPAKEAFVVRNRVLGELALPEADERETHRLAEDSALVNVAYRTPHYLLGSTLQNPALALVDPTTGKPTIAYAGISRQKRACSLLFDDPSQLLVAQVHPVIEHPGGGRPQHSLWSVQHENALVIQRIPQYGKSTMGSYHTGRLGMRFDGESLQIRDDDVWIFATNGKAFVAVKFLDGAHAWNDTKTEAFPKKDPGPHAATRILLHAGDIASQPSFKVFCQAVKSSPLVVTTDLVDYRFGDGRQIEVHRYDPAAAATFELPRIDGKPVELRPRRVYDSPFLESEFGTGRVTVRMGGHTRVLDFNK